MSTRLAYFAGDASLAAVSSRRMPKVYGSTRARRPESIPSAVALLKSPCLLPARKARVFPAGVKPEATQSCLDSFILQPSLAHNRSGQAGSSKPRLPPAQTSRPVYSQTVISGRSLLRTCAVCGMSYVRGGSRDELAHKRHHRGVVSGVRWDERGSWNLRAVDVSGEARLPREAPGKIVCLPGSDASDKLAEILGIVDTVLSAPPLPSDILKHCKVFLYITSRITEEKGHTIVGVCVSQKIRWAMRVLEARERDEAVECDPHPVPASLGIHRLFTLPSMRRKGIASALLSAACQRTIYGREIKPESGKVAFSQPTRSGKAVMDGWGKGSVLVFVDDASQCDA